MTEPAEPTAPTAPVDPLADPYRWLEDVTGDAALAWVRERADRTVAALSDTARFAEMRDAIRDALDRPGRIPATTWRGEHLYNLWQDEEHPRGLWRRTTLAAFRKDEPEWEILLDVDALGAAEGVNWVFQECVALRPAHERFLIHLSRGGADASVVREFDVPTRSFVDDGFVVPEAKTRVGWIDRDTIFVGTDFGPGSLTSSGYARVKKRWRRGTPLTDAETVFEVRPDDMMAIAYHDQTEGYARDLLVRRIDFFSAQMYVLSRDGGRTLIDAPVDCDLDLHREWLTLRLRTPWTVGDVTYPGGALLAAEVDAFLAGSRDLTVLFEPSDSTALDDYTWTRNHLILSVLSDVRSRLLVRTPGPGGWTYGEIAGLPEFSHSAVAAANQYDHDEVLLRSSGYLEPATLRHAVIGGQPEIIKQEAAAFDASGLEVRQLFATSDDGTRVPYFVIGRPSPEPAPALLLGYGGFEISATPAYSVSDGIGWLARGGVLVEANIRGGGEYGPRWHRAALRENRPRAFEDFAAVARDLVVRGITTPAQLAAEGGSNGGLLMGVMLTRYPELFGAIVSHVPLLDMRRYHELLAGASWIAEYGNPDNPADWAFLGQYSPYHHVHKGRTYPATIFLTSTRDDRVHPGHARKMVARLEELGYTTDFYENIEGGHGAAADNAQRAFRAALTYEFLWRRLG